MVPEEIREDATPTVGGDLRYLCGRCKRDFSPDKSMDSCPVCGGLTSLVDLDFARLSSHPFGYWRKIFDLRSVSKIRELWGVFSFHEFTAPLIPLDCVCYLGEGMTPMVFSELLSQKHGTNVFFKYDGLNPTLSFKDRGMACALSHANYLIKRKGADKLIAICASTGDTSAAAACYAAALGSKVRSMVLLPQGLVTPQQLIQPTAAGATVIELPGAVFDDCMRVVGALSRDYEVVLLNSKNPWRLLGQESYAFELARSLDYDLQRAVIFLPVGNAGNITAVLNGFLKFYKAGVVSSLPKVMAVQSVRADPLFKYMADSEEEDDGIRVFESVSVKPSVAQAAMIGNPVSFPRLRKLILEYRSLTDQDRFRVVEVSETQIMEGMLEANRLGHPICTQGGECLAAFGILAGRGEFSPSDMVVLDSTAHFLKFMEFQNAYYEDGLKNPYGVESKGKYKNAPKALKLKGRKTPGAGRTLSAAEYQDYLNSAADEIAEIMGMEMKN
jgi:threonine synthase